MSEIRFGTNGWRGVLGRDFSAEGAERLARALAAQLGAPALRPRVVVAFDTRAQAAAIAQRSARALAAAGAAPLLAARPTPTPVAGFLVRARAASAGFVVTASHNPPEYLGVKLLAESGESAGRRFVDAVAAAANALAPGGPDSTGSVRSLAQPARGYLDAVAAALQLVRGRPRVLYDAMGGTGAGVVDALLRRLGARVVVIHGRPGSGDGTPDPVRPRLRALVRAVRAGGFAFGLATDGDADRFALVDGGGQLLSETESLALLVDHLAATRALPGGLALSSVTGSLAERAARARGLPVRRTGFGFSALARCLREGSADVAGEESGGFAWRRVGFDKDGILAGALALEAAAAEPLAVRLSRLRRAQGSSACGRSALSATAEARRALARLVADPPERLGGLPVSQAARDDGLRLALADGFLCWRESGTEPVIRIYAEAPTRAALAQRLAAGAALLR